MVRGLDAQQQSFASNPDDRRAFEALEEHFFLEGDWPALARIYRSRIAAPSIERDPAQKAALLFRLGQILEERIVDLEAACDTYWALARLDRSFRPALRQLRGIHERRGQWDVVLQIAELEAATAMPPFERAQFEAELARIWHRHLRDHGEAERAYARALAVDPEFPPALEGLAELYLETARAEQAAGLLERLTVRLRGPERAPFWLALARVAWGVLADRARARACLVAALEDDPLLTPAVEWALLLATEDEDWGAVAELLEHRFDLAAGARHRAAIAVEASQIHLHQRRSTANARAWVERATELADDDRSVLYACADVERAEGNDEVLAGVLERLVKKAGARVSRPLLGELAEVHARRGQPAAALAALDRIRAAETGDDLRLLELRAACLRQTGAKGALAEVLETLVNLEAGQTAALRAERLAELARLCEDELSDPAAAEVHWSAAFALAPTDPEALASLERLQRKREDLPALRHTLETALRAAGEAPAPSLCSRLGELLIDAFDDVAAARACFERALQSAPVFPPALAGLRRVAERTADPALLLELCEREAASCDDGQRFVELARQAIAVLLPQGEVARAHAWAVRASERTPDSRAAQETRAGLEARLGLRAEEVGSLGRLAALLSGSERGRCLQRRADLQLELGDWSAAAETLESLLVGEPTNVEALRALADVHQRLARPADQARCLRAWSEQVPAALRAEPLVRLAAILEDPIGDLEAAIAVRGQLLELPTPPADAATALAALLELSGRHDELVALLERERRRLGDDAPEARALDLRRGRLLLDALGDCEAAAALFSALHERDPADDLVLGLLERALRAGRDAAGLCALLARRASWETDAVARAPFELERAQLLDEVLGQPQAACDVYERILTDAPDSAAAAPARARLETLCEATGQWSRLHQLLLARVEAVPAAERTPLRERIAEICRDQLQDPAGCAVQLEAIAVAHPERVQVWQQLQDLYTRVLDRPAEWLRIVQAELASVPVPRRELALRVGIGRLLLDPARRPKGTSEADATAHFARAFELDPSHAEAAEILARHFEHEGRPRDVVRILEAHLLCLDEVRVAERDDLRLRLARVYIHGLADDERARRLLESVRASRGAVREVAEPLAAILERSSRPESERELAALCHDTIRRLENERERLPWRVRLGRAAMRSGDLDEAARSFRAALLQAPSDPSLEDALIEIYERQDEREPLIELLERRLAFASTEAELALRLRLARLYADEPVDAAQALTHLERILECVPHHREALDLALSRAREVADPARERALLERALGLPLASNARAEVLERRALCAGDAPDGIEQGIEDLREALALDPTRTRARRALRERLTALERWPAVLECLSLEAASESGGARCALLEQGAALAGSKLGPDAELPWLARLRGERPDDPSLWARLAVLHRRAGRFEAALRALDEELALRPADARLELEIERARLLEQQLDAPGRAVLAYQAALSLASDRGPILAELDRLLAALGRPLERAAILEERVSPLAGRSGIELRRALADLYCTALARPESAVVHLRANVAATTDVPAEELHHQGALAAALRASNREEEWAAVAERELHLIETHPELRDHTPLEFQRFLRDELARIFDRVTGDPERALVRMRELCDDARFAGDGVPARFHERLHDLLRRTGRRAELADRLARFLAEHAGESRDWLELAVLREEEQADWESARAAYREAERDPRLRLEAIRGRRRCAERLADDAGIAESLRDELALELPVSRRERGQLARTLGALAWQRLGSADEACAAYQIALELDPRDHEALTALIGIRETRGERVAAIALHRRELALLGESESERARRAASLIRLATLHAGGSEDEVLDAIAAYREAAELGRLPAHDERALALLHERAGDADACFEVLGRWCDRDDSPAGVEDHLDLATRLARAGRALQALARARRAVAVAPGQAAAWALLGQLQREQDGQQDAVESFERAANLALPIEASRYCSEAAAIAAPRDPARAHALLLRATRADASSFTAHAALARVSSRLDRPTDVLRHAELALELAHGRKDDRDDLQELALLGARAATSLAEGNARIRLYQAALALAPDLAEALDGLADAHFAAGDLHAARPLLERRLAQSAGGAAQARQHWMHGAVLEAAGELELALHHQRQAILLDPTLDAAHESLVRLEERAARPAEALAALEAWAEASRHPGVRARAALRGAEHALAAGDPLRARRQLESATRQDPELGEAWALLCDVAAGQTSETELRELCQTALSFSAPGPHAARIALRLARLAEVTGDPAEAIARYGEAWRWDPRCSEAALCESRLARVAGDWLEADGVLARFLETHPDPESASLAQVHLERGRLLSGPLEAFEQAIHAYQRALTLQPGLAVARSALAGLLLHAPDRGREALALHREILASAPTTAASLRALATLGERRGRSDVASAASGVLCALGLASPQESEGGPIPFSLPLRAGPPLSSAEGERLRRLAHQIRDELGRLLDAEPSALPPIAPAAEGLPIAEIHAVEDELTARGFSRLGVEARRSLFLSIGGLFLDPGGNGGDARYRDPLERALGLWTRRKARRIVEETTLASIEAFDHEDFGHELRALAAAQLLDREQCGLREVLLALIALDEEAAHAAGLARSELAGAVTSCEAARRLMVRITNVLCEKLERGR